MRKQANLDSLVVPEQSIERACSFSELPKLGVIERVWETDPIPPDAVADSAAAATESLDWGDVPDGGTVAVCAGSRGIANLPAIVRGTVEGIRDRGYDPFVIPAMGSHGGATAEGQREKLADLGVTEDAIDCEIRSSMDVVEVGTTPERNVSVYADANAVAADAIVPVNRIKPHTDFSGTIESGLSKMLVSAWGNNAARRWPTTGPSTGVFGT